MDEKKIAGRVLSVRPTLSGKELNYLSKRLSKQQKSKEEERLEYLISIYFNPYVKYD